MLTEIRGYEGEAAALKAKERLELRNVLISSRSTVATVISWKRKDKNLFRMQSLQYFPKEYAKQNSPHLLKKIACLCLQYYH